MSNVVFFKERDLVLRVKLMQWFGAQDQDTKVQILRKKFGLFEKYRNIHRIKKGYLTLLEIHCLFEAIEVCGWQDEQDFRKGKNISDEALDGIAQRRKQRAYYQYKPHRAQVGGWLQSNWRIVSGLRENGLGWRRVSRKLLAEYGVSISHTSLMKYARRYDSEGV